MGGGGAPPGIFHGGRLSWNFGCYNWELAINGDVNFPSLRNVRLAGVYPSYLVIHTQAMHHATLGPERAFAKLSARGIIM